MATPTAPVGTFVQDDGTIDYTPNADTNAGTCILVGKMLTVTRHFISANIQGSLAYRGIFDITKHSGDTFTQGADVYWDDTAKDVTSTSTANTLIGRAAKAAASGDATARVILLPSLAGA